MSQRTRWRSVLCNVAVSLGLLTMSACASLSQPSAQPTATQPILDDLAVYKMLTDKYTAYYVILGINDMPVDEAARILQALKGIEPPAGLEELHQQAIRAYEYVCAGKLLLPGSDSQLRAEAYFEIDWGVKLLFDYREQLDNVAQPTGRSVQ